MSEFRIVCASHIEEVFSKNLGRSPMYHKANPDDVTVIRNKTNIPQAYNAARRGEHFTIFSHHDVFYPEGFLAALYTSMQLLPKDWGVLGVAGARFVNNTRKLQGYVMDRGTPWGQQFTRPERVETLDELVLIVNSNYDLRFDPQFEQDFYGADICMQAITLKLKNFVIPAFCEHNSQRVKGSAKPPTFYESEGKFKHKWKQWLPLATTCSIMLR